MKPILQHLDNIPDNKIRQEAFQNYYQQRTKSELVTNFSDALALAFHWGNSPQGWRYWQNVCTKYEYLDNQTMIAA